MAGLLTAILCVFLAVQSTQGAGFLFQGDVIKPSPPRGFIMTARNDQLIGSVQAPAALLAAPKNVGLQSSVTIIRTTVVTVTETTVLEKVSTKSVTIYVPTVTTTIPCLGKTAPGRQDGAVPLFDTKPVAPKPSAPKPALFVNYPVYYPKPAKPTEVKTVDFKPIVVKPTEVKPALVKPTQVKPVIVKATEVKTVDFKPIVVKPTEVKTTGVTPVVAKPAASKPVSKPSLAVIEAKPFLGDLPILGMNPAFPTKPTKTNPVENVPFVTKPSVTKPVGTKPEVKPVVVKPAQVKPIVTKPVDVKPVVAKPFEAKPIVSKPVEAVLAHDKLDNVQGEFIQLMAEFTALMNKLTTPPSQAALVRRFRSVSKQEVVWRHNELSVHHEELSDELRLLVKQIKEVQLRPDEFYEHLETFVSYMEEIS